jgi:cytochrome P450
VPIVSELREWIRAADDSSYSSHIVKATAESPRTAVADLYGPLAAARERHPVQPHGQSALVGLADFRTMSHFTDRPLYSLLGFDEVQAGFADSETFSSSIHNETIGQVWGHTLLGMDGARHRHNRGLIAHAFRRQVLERWRTELIEPIVAGLVDRFAARGSADLVSEFTMLFPVYVITELLGLPRDDIPKFMSWAADTIVVFHDPETAFAASTALGEYLQDQIDRRRGHPSTDMIGDLMAAEVDGRRLSDQEIVNFVRVLLPAGAETTYRSTSNLLTGLLCRPDQFAALAADPTLLDPAIEEGLRWEAPLTALNRITTRDVEMSGVTIPRGAIVACSIGAANRDPSRWTDPDTFDVFREPKAHIAFAYGPHLCLGMHLARFETRAALRELITRLPDLRLDPDAEPPQIRGIGFRSPAALPVLFDPGVEP